MSSNSHDANRSTTVVRADLGHLEQVIPLFDAYRVFYEQQSDLIASRRFLEQRIERDESVVFVANYDSEAVGFTQLYPVFSSTALSRLWLLNDLFVAPPARRLGVARALMSRAKTWASETKALGLFLRTAVDNLPAQALYESMGYIRDTKFYRYDRILDQF